MSCPRFDADLSECSGGGVRVMVVMPQLVCDIDITTLLRCLFAFKSSMGLLTDAQGQPDGWPMVEWSDDLSCPLLLLSDDHLYHWHASVALDWPAAVLFNGFLDLGLHDCILHGMDLARSSPDVQDSLQFFAHMLAQDVVSSPSGFYPIQIRQSVPILEDYPVDDVLLAGCRR